MNEELVKRLHDRLGAMIDQVGQPDYSLRELVIGLRDIRDEMFSAITAQQEPVAPKWYSREEIIHILRRMKYSDEIAQELADWIVRHLQLAFNKGWQMAGGTTPPSAQQEPVSWEEFKAKADEVFTWVAGLGGYEDAVRALHQLTTQTAGVREGLLLGGARFKLSFNGAGNVSCFSNYREQLDGQWVALIDATNDRHLRAEAERVEPHVMVPVEPTTEMVAEGLKRAVETGEITEVYRAMLRAAQEGKK